MPIWDFFCPHCNTTTEQHFPTYAASHTAKCPTCGATTARGLTRQPSSGAIVFKGSGFYKTDYPKTS